MFDQMKFAVIVEFCLCDSRYYCGSSCYCSSRGIVVVQELDPGGFKLEEGVEGLYGENRLKNPFKLKVNCWKLWRFSYLSFLTLLNKYNPENEGEQRK